MRPGACFLAGVRPGEDDGVFLAGVLAGEEEGVFLGLPGEARRAGDLDGDLA